MATEKAIASMPLQSNEKRNFSLGWNTVCFCFGYGISVPVKLRGELSRVRPARISISTAKSHVFARWHQRLGSNR
jgi:hypothetical protein